MCGRYTLKTPGERVARMVGLPGELTLEPRYNIAPSQRVAAVRPTPEGGEREVVMLRWGLVPSWAKDPSVGNRMINARAETVATKPAFGTAFRRRRCLVLADGFFEWQRVGRTKQPFYVCMRDGAPFAFAGLWDRWRGENSTAIESCTLLTTEPNELLRPVHSRMPVILAREDYDTWLDAGLESASLHPLLSPYPAEAMTLYPVSRRINDPRNDDPSCIQPAS